MTNAEGHKIFSEGRIAGLDLRNRIIRAGCFEGMCQDESPSELLLEHHREVAAGGVGMTTVAYCAVSRNGLAFGHEMWMREEIVPMLERIAAAVHQPQQLVRYRLAGRFLFLSGRNGLLMGCLIFQVLSRLRYLLTPACLIESTQ